LRTIARKAAKKMESFFFLGTCAAFRLGSVVF